MQEGDTFVLTSRHEGITNEDVLHSHLDCIFLYSHSLRFVAQVLALSWVNAVDITADTFKQIDNELMVDIGDRSFGWRRWSCFRRLTSFNYFIDPVTILLRIEHFIQ